MTSFMLYLLVLSCTSLYRIGTKQYIPWLVQTIDQYRDVPGYRDILIAPRRPGLRVRTTYDCMNRYVIWILASSDIGGLPYITAPDIGDSRISQYPYSDIGVTDIGELRYHSTTTPITEYQFSDIDSYIGGTVISEVWPSISENYTSDIGVNRWFLISELRPWNPFWRLRDHYSVQKLSANLLQNGNGIPLCKTEADLSWWCAFSVHSAAVSSHILDFSACMSEIY